MPEAREKILKAIESTRESGRIPFHEIIFKIVEPVDSNKSITVTAFKEVARLNEGQNFGELALVKNSGRSATIICARACRFATLNRKDYKLTIGTEERRKLKDNVRLLRQYRIFQPQTVTDNTLVKVFQFMKVVKFRHG